jgi:DNA-directed RNA polymerase subunit omega
MSIVDPCVLELLKHADSRYTLVVEASKRGRQIVGGSQPYFDAKDLKPLKTAVEEINRDLITYDRPVEEEEQVEA